MNTPDVSQLLAAADEPTPGVGRRWLMVSSLVGLAIVVGVAWIIVSLIMRQQSEALHAKLDERLSLLANSRVSVIETWLNGTARLASNLVNSDLMRLYATEIDLTVETDPLAARLSDQAPYMAELFNEFVRQQGLQAVYLINREGRAVLANGAAPEPTSAQREAAMMAYNSGETVFSPLRVRGQEIELDVHRPVRAVQASDPSQTPPVVAVFTMTVPVTSVVADFVAEDPLSEPGERTAILQIDPAASDVVAVMPMTAGSLVHVAVPVGRDPLPFGERASLVATGDVLSVGLPVRDVPWLVLQEVDRDIALAPLTGLSRILIAIAVLAVAVIGATLFAVWYNQSNAFNRAMASQYLDLAARIDAQRRLLDGINGAIRELIGLKRLDGTYAYVNPAFAEAVGRPVEQIIGQSDEAVFGHGQAKKLEHSDQAAMEGEAATRAEEQIYLGGKRRFLEISKVPLRRGAPPEAIDGIVTVARDVTELVEERRRLDAALRQTIDALVKTIELSDPYLAGHSRLVRHLAVLMAHELDLPQEDVATLEIAANLAQIGKLFVPRDILNKPERLTPEEMRVMETHIEHAAKVLSDIDFGLPVRETVLEMYERMDGSGYPRRLHGEDIRVTARILGLADVFAARIRPRSYRSGITPDEALSAVKTYSTAKFGDSVVRALEASIQTTEGEEVLSAPGG